MEPFTDRDAAGKALAEAVAQAMVDDEPADSRIVLALPRGGVPVAAWVAQRLHAQLDLMVVRKLGVPWHPELAMGAVASGGIRIVNDDVIRHARVSEQDIDAVQQAEETELRRRERCYRGDHPLPDLTGRPVILVDDGIATGATMKAAIEAVRRQSPARIIVAVPVAPPDTVRALEARVDQVVCVLSPTFFNAIGAWYRDFAQTQDETVRELLQQAWHGTDRN